MDYNRVVKYFLRFSCFSLYKELEPFICHTKDAVFFWLIFYKDSDR